MMDERKRTYLRDLQEAVQSKNYEDLATLFPDLKGEIAKEYSGNMKSMFEYGKKVTSDEMQVDVPETSKDVRGLYRAQGLQMEAKLQNEMGITAQSEALYQIARGAASAYTLDMIEKALDNKLQKIITASGTQALG